MILLVCPSLYGDTTYLAICNTQIFFCYYLWTKIKRESKTANRKLSCRVVCGVIAVRWSLLFNHIRDKLACCLSLFARRSRAKPCWTEGWQFYIWNWVTKIISYKLKKSWHGKSKTEIRQYALLIPFYVLQMKSKTKNSSVKPSYFSPQK